MNRAKYHCSQGISRDRKAFWAVLALWTFGNLAFVHMTHLGLAGDEAQYWDWSRHLDWGYYSKPPMIAWIIALLTRIGGTSEAAIRSGAALFASGTLVFIHALARRITRRESTALVAACMSLAMTSSWAGSVMLTIDAPMAFFWAFAMYSFHRAISGDRGWWLITGVALGLGMLTKYTMLALVVSFLAYLILFDRGWLRRPGPYLMLGIMFLAMIPVVYWNVAHDWVSVRHTASIGTRGEKSFGKTIGHVLEFVGGQLGIVSPILFGFFAWAMVVMAKKANLFRPWVSGIVGVKTNMGDDNGFGYEQEKASGLQPPSLGLRPSALKKDAAYLFLCTMILFGFYALVAFTRKTEPNWPICAYLSAVIAFAWAWHDRPRTSRMRKLLYAGVILGCLVGVFSRTTEWLYRASARFAPENARIENVYLGPLHFRAKKEPTNRLFGGRELGRTLSKHVRTGDPSAPFICSENYQFVAWAAFYTEGRPRTYCVNLGDRRYNQYDLWGGWEALVGRDALFIVGDPPEVAQPRIEKALALGAFERLDGIEVVNVYRQRTLVKVFTIARLRGYTGYAWRPDTEQY
ncbi:MAG TPA: glycosyltransferase family 39 protein [Candidatus Hydrogenedentes bacterium]|nr:glycosyltransferase family 39 protein [Candidatus Hydrogenedentota bacterium]HRT18976.1 glycosyltransferase family 39 protein [Candidatus Hydrogenedentota bacterium]HRT65668.1 glycosyltransferase family 39 protein [Candidatus Hydrogenedentota bacterium]